MGARGHLRRVARRRRLRLERRLLDLGPQRERRDLLLVGQPRLLQPRLGCELLELALLARRLSLLLEGRRRPRASWSSISLSSVICRSGPPARTRASPPNTPRLGRASSRAFSLVSWRRVRSSPRRRAVSSIARCASASPCRTARSVSSDASWPSAPAPGDSAPGRLPNTAGERMRTSWISMVSMRTPHPLSVASSCCPRPETTGTISYQLAGEPFLPPRQAFLDGEVRDQPAHGAGKHVHEERLELLLRALREREVQHPERDERLRDAVNGEPRDLDADLLEGDLVGRELELLDRGRHDGDAVARELEARGALTGGGPEATPPHVNQVLARLGADTAPFLELLWIFGRLAGAPGPDRTARDRPPRSRDRPRGGPPRRRPARRPRG